MTRDRRPTPDMDTRLDAELARAARALVTEELPRGILDAGLAPAHDPGGIRARRSVPAYAGLAATLVLLLATAIALVPGGTPPASPAPSPASSLPSSSPAGTAGAASPSSAPTAAGLLRSTSAIRSDLETLAYTCVVGNVLLPTGPSPSAMVKEGAICTAPADAGPFMEVVVVGEAADGRPVQVHLKADLTGDDTTVAREALASSLAKAVAVAPQGEGTGSQLGAWVEGAIPGLAPGSSNSTRLVGFAVKVSRSSNGGYVVVVFPQ